VNDYQLGRLVMQAVSEAETLKANGGDPETVAKGLEAVVRELWPKGRESDWRELCAECHDYGWQTFQCSGDATCGRPKRHLPHDWVKPCWCEKGRALTPKPQQETDELVAISKVSRPTRFGR